MSLAGLVGISIVGAATVATLMVAILRAFLVSWCPCCDGRGCVPLSQRLALACDVCKGSGILRVPDAPPAGWFVGNYPGA